VLFYGEEIGMGENLEVPGRLAVRTPMQWTPTPSGGFSTAAPGRLTRPMPTGLWGPEHVNVADQRRDPASLWWFVRSLARRYRQLPESGWATVEVLDHPVPAVLAHVSRCGDWAMLALHNFGEEGVIVPLVVSDLPSGARLVDVLADRPAISPPASGRLELELEPYGYRWLLVVREGENPLL
jgi:glycosidase